MQAVPRKKIGVLLAQLGTPAEPTSQALRPYLRQFLSDMRVIDYPPLVWQPILRGMILVTRPRRSARLYARIWTQDGSPLLVYSLRQAAGLQELLGDAYRVVLGMRYGEPSIRSAIRSLEAAGITRIIVLPMYPQFSSTTTASIYDAVYEAAGGRHHPLNHERKRFIPTLRFIEPYYDHPLYIEAMCQRLRETLNTLPEMPDQFVVTFHGIPNRYIQTGDPYRQHSEATARLLAAAMGWRDDEWRIGFQSRFGPEAWLEPYTDQVLTSLHRQGIERPLVFSPGFVTDCLETLDELGNEGREEFSAGGGNPEHFHLAACLNDHPAWIDAMAALVHANAGGWVEADAATKVVKINV